MTRSRLCRVCGKFHSLEECWPLECSSHWGESPDAAPMIRPDGMDAIRSMADGRMYDGRSAYYDSVKRAGCEIIGNDREGYGRRKTVDDLIPKNIGRDVRDAMEQLKARS